MNEQARNLAQTLLNTAYEALSEREQRVIRRIVKRLHVSRNTNLEFDEQLSFGERLADRVAAFGGSWTFIVLFAVILALWVVMNSFIRVLAAG